MPRLYEKELTKGQLRNLKILRRTVGDKLANQTYAQFIVDKKKLTKADKPDQHMLKLERTVAKLVKGGLKIPPSGIKITRSRHGISVSKIEMKRKLRKRKAKKAAAKK